MKPKHKARSGPPKMDHRTQRWIIQHGRYFFTNTMAISKRRSIQAYVDGCDPGWTWKKLYAVGARAVRCRCKITVMK